LQANEFAALSVATPKKQKRRKALCWGVLAETQGNSNHAITPLKINNLKVIASYWCTT
jgi:hypothetical protein